MFLFLGFDVSCWVEDEGHEVVLERPGRLDVHVSLQVVLEQAVVRQVVQVGHWKLLEFFVRQFDLCLLHLFVSEVHLVQTRLQVLGPDVLVEQGEAFEPLLLIKLNSENVGAVLACHRDPKI